MELVQYGTGTQRACYAMGHGHQWDCYTMGQGHQWARYTMLQGHQSAWYTVGEEGYQWNWYTMGLGHNGPRTQWDKNISGTNTQWDWDTREREKYCRTETRRHWDTMVLPHDGTGPYLTRLGWSGPVTTVVISLTHLRITPRGGGSAVGRVRGGVQKGRWTWDVHVTTATLTVQLPLQAPMLASLHTDDPEFQRGQMMVFNHQGNHRCL